MQKRIFEFRYLVIKLNQKTIRISKIELIPTSVDGLYGDVSLDRETGV